MENKLIKLSGTSLQTNLLKLKQHTLLQHVTQKE